MTNFELNRSEQICAINEDELDYIINLIKEDSNEDFRRCYETLNIFRALCTAKEKIPNDFFNVLNADKQLALDKIISCVQFRSEDQFSWISFGDWIIQRYFSRKIETYLVVIYRVFRKIFSSTTDSYEQIEEFVLRFWREFSENDVRIPDVTMRMIVRKLPFVLEKYVIEQLQATINEAYYDSTEFERFAKLCCNSSYIFQIITGILNEILLTSCFGHTLPFITKLIQSIKIKKSDSTITTLYPLSLQPLISICQAFRTRDDVPKGNQKEEQMLNDMLQNMFNSIRHTKQILAILSHFPEWISYADELVPPLKTEYLKVLRLE